MSHSKSFSTGNEIIDKFDYMIRISKMLDKIENEIIIENSLEKEVHGKTIYNFFSEKNYIRNNVITIIRIDINL